MKIIGVCGRKGGSSKSTISVHVASELAAAYNLSVTLVDCDVQGSSRHWAEPGKLPIPVQYMPLENARQVRAWSRHIHSIDAEIIVLDSPPHLDAALGGIIGLSDLALVPCGPSGLDLIATGETVGLIREIRAAKGDKKPKIALIPSRMDKRTLAGRELTDALAELGETVGPTIGARTAFSDAFNIGDWVGSYAPESEAHREMQSLSDFVIKELGLRRKRNGKKGQSRAQRA